MEFRLLGAFEVRLEGVPLAFGGPRQRAVLAALALRANEVVSVDHLIDAVWEQPPASAASNIRTYVRELRRVLGDAGGARLVTRSPGYLLVTRPGQVDAATFEELARQGLELAGRERHAEAVELLDRALGCWHGEPLDSLPLGAGLRTEVAALEARRLAVAEEAVRCRQRLGDHGGAVAGLRALLDRYPLREDLWAALMGSLRAGGRSAEALDAYQQVRGLLVAELGVDPGAELRALYQEILRDDDQSAAEGTAPVGSLPAAAVPVPAEVRRPAPVRQLPMDVVEFTGRVPELRELMGFAADADSSAGSGTAVPVCVIRGMAGVGKTRLAVRAAHQIIKSGRFDDVQLYVDLHGFAPGREPTPPAAVLESFLRLLGVPGDRIPPDPADRAALYRDRLAGRRALVLLDNAAGEEQVRPLLPGSPTALILVTSRRTLSGLDGARRIALEVFTEAEAGTLLARIAGAERVAADPEAAGRIVAGCGRLPIALTLAARRLAARPTWTLADLADRLDAANRRQGGLSADTRSVRATFDLSYQALPEELRRMFRLLALHPGDDTTPGSAAALADTGPRRAEELLEALLDEHLLQQTVPGRYRYGSLLLPYAREKVETDESPAGRDAARTRVLGWYLHAAAAADRSLDPRRRQIDTDPCYAPREVPDFADHAEALGWFEAERGNLVAAAEAAAAAGLDVIAWQLPAAMLSFFYLRSHWDDWIATHRVGLAAARRLGNRKAEAATLDRLGVVHSDLRRYDESCRLHSEALAIERAIDDPHGQAWTLNNLGVALCDMGRHAEALECFTTALPLFRQVGDPRGEGLALNNLGDTYRRLHRIPEAAQRLEEALEVQERHGDRPGRRYTLQSLGDLHHDLGDPDRAADHYRRALEINKALSDRWGTARTLTRLGRTSASTGDSDTARWFFRQALSLLDVLADPRAAEVRAHLKKARTPVR
jgi:DNA-binding SARP family transcriptional activator